MTTTNMSKSVVWPLVFKYRGPVFGTGFISYVDLCGKLLASLETEGFWLDGVNPGAFAIGAKTLEEANVKLREALTAVFVDFAEAADSFSEFKAAVEDFYNQTDAETEREWDEAINAVRQGWIAVPANLDRRPDWKCFVRVIQKPVDEVTPNDNPMAHSSQQDPLALAAA